MAHFAAAIFALVLCGHLISAQLDFHGTSLKIHNELRSLHIDTPDMIQDADLNERAQKCADYYARIQKIDHSCPFKNGAGENLYRFSSWPIGPKQQKMDANQVSIDAARSFHDEHKFYNWDKPISPTSETTFHFTQLVWIKSTKLGSGYAFRKDDIFSNHTFVNLYLEQGNLLTEEAYRENVSKFKKIQNVGN